MFLEPTQKGMGMTRASLPTLQNSYGGWRGVCSREARAQLSLTSPPLSCMLNPSFYLLSQANFSSLKEKEEYSLYHTPEYFQKFG